MMKIKLLLITSLKLTFQTAQLIRKNFCFFFELFCSFLRIDDLLFQVKNFLRELSLNVLKFLFNLFKLLL